MKPVHGGLAVLTVLALAVFLGPTNPQTAAADEPPDETPAADPLAFSAISHVIAANRGKPPESGEELVKALGKLGHFAQLPVVFSAVRHDSGVSNPRVVLTPYVAGPSRAEANRPNLDGRLFLAANMERGARGGDPRVTSIEFISWNARRKRFDFGVIENMGGGEDSGKPEVRVVDGGKCFACHRNRGPILGKTPWSNTTHNVPVRELVMARHRVFPVAPRGTPGADLRRDRIDGMALATPEAATVDSAVRVGSVIQLTRETFRLMARSPGGRKALAALLGAVVGSAKLDPVDERTALAVDGWANDPTFSKFCVDALAIHKGSNSGVLLDLVPAGVSEWNSRLARHGPATAALDNKSQADLDASRRNTVAAYDADRAAGYPGLPKDRQPSNPRAFLPMVAQTSSRPLLVVNPTLLANTIGVTEGDRKFMARSLADAVAAVKKPKVTAASLVKEVVEGRYFANVLEGGPLPDRDEFKDRFVAGLDDVLKTRHGVRDGFAPDRREYAIAPRQDLSAVTEEVVAVVVPTTACLRCHDVRPNAKSPRFDPIPPLAFDPLDKTGRETWAKTPLDRPARQQALERMTKRLFGDADMPPEDSPEHSRFRVNEAAAFEDARQFIDTELKKLTAK
jgi:hypothetical protein